MVPKLLSGRSGHATRRGLRGKDRSARSSGWGMGLSDPLVLYEGMSQENSCDQGDRPGQETHLRSETSKEIGTGDSFFDAASKGGSE